MIEELDNMRGFVIGRYQPFHNGHLEVIREIMNDVDCDELIIAIGSAQVSHTLKDPFTAGERISMIYNALSKEGIDNYFLIPVIDINRYAVWVSHVKSLVPKIDIVYTNNALTKRLFIERNYNVRTPKLYDREQYSGTKIRELIINDGAWKQLVPESVATIIKDIDGIQRLKDLVKSQ